MTINLSSRHSVESVLDYIRIKTAEFEKAPEERFQDIIKTNWRARTDVLNSPGVHVIYENRKVIYVGMAGKGKHSLNFRLGDLFFHSEISGRNRFHHTLTEKLLTRVKRFKTIEEVRRFYFRCRVKTVETGTFQQARTIEAVLIELLKPGYND